MGPRVPFAPSLLTLSLHITLHIDFISFRLFILLYVTCIMVNKVVKKKNDGKMYCAREKNRMQVAWRQLDN